MKYKKKVDQMVNITQTLSPNPEDIDAVLITGNFIHTDFMQ